MAARSIMFMGTGSDVGKSLVVAGLARAYANRGLRVAPFKPQNMSNNAAVTADGGEIGRAQALQARAARREPVTAMNPVLLKPEGETGSQLVVRGTRVASYRAREYWSVRHELLPAVRAAHAELAADADLVLVEGAGSASEVNLRSGDIANFGFARSADVPVVLVADIERGGVIAALVGTFAVIDPDDAALVVATLVNKFRGDPELFDNGKQFIAERTNRPSLGPVPFFPGANRLPAEDILGLADSSGTGAYRVVVPRLPRISNFDDLDPLRLEPGVSVEIVEPGRPLPFGDLIVLPGSKATRADLAALRAEGWDIDILAHHRAGARVLGLCGGFQMLGRSVADPDGVEGEAGTSPGLGLLEVETVLGDRKELRVEHAVSALTGDPLVGYHMHMGVSQGTGLARPFARLGNAADGAISPDGTVMGTYLHGVFAADAFRRNFLGAAAATSTLNYEAMVDATLDALAGHLERHLDLDHLLGLAR
jgi:adenosylcobyric acid synthase